MQDWLSMLRDAAREGRRFARVRVVSLPFSDYNRWSYVIAQHNIAAGEDIRYLTSEPARQLKLPNHDYWLFDSRKLLRMRFDEADHFLGGEIIEDSAQIVRHNYWRDAAWHYAVRRDEFATKEHSQRI
jgi:predicted phosphohydrolase